MKKIISINNLPKRMPLVGTVAYITALDHYNSPMWLVGAIGLLIVLAWLLWIVHLLEEKKEIDIFQDKESK